MTDVTRTFGSHIAQFTREDDVCLLNTHSLRTLFVDARWLADRSNTPPGDFLALPPLRAPKPELQVFQIAVTLACNLRCSYCVVHNNVWGDATHTMSRETARELAEEANAVLPPGGLLYLTGGEPLLNWSAAATLLADTRDDLLKVIVTNATRVKPEIASFLAATRTCVLVSMDGDQYAHDSVRHDGRGRGSYDAARRGYDILRGAGCSVGVSLVIGPHNADRLSDVAVHLLETLHPDSLGLGLPHFTSRHARSIDEHRVAAEYGRLYDWVLTQPTFVDQIARRLSPFVNETFRFRDCSACGSKVVVFPDGSRSNCISSGPDHLGGAADRWLGRTPLDLAECKGCAAMGVCGGGCVFDGLALYGGVDQRNCAVTRVLLEKFIWTLRDATTDPQPGTAVKSAVFNRLLERRSRVAVSVGHSQ